uniref:L-2-hydroxyglutarate dehydrogenase, mitochondrial n=1 Tax=Panagrellus redivivus TaxID=6233 RepID=A0A7E4VRZ4_PANRE
MSKSVFDVVVVGAGIVGAATARQLAISRPALSIALIDKEAHVAGHQSGHNSGVIHAGIYYVPGSLKAKLCVQGIDLAYDYLNQKGIPHKKVGKLIVATDETKVKNLEVLFDRATKNGCRDIELVDAKRIKELEPLCRGIKAIWSPHTGIVDWGLVTKHYVNDFEASGGQLFLKHGLRKISHLADSGTHPVLIETDGSKAPKISCKHLITCTGVYSDRIAQLTGCDVLPKMVPIRGEYLKLKPHKSGMVKTNIYPVPDPRFPFLGVHFTPNMKGEILLGPNAVLAFSREGYKFFDFSPKDFIDAVSYSGIRKLMFKYFAFGFGQVYRSFVTRAQVKELQEFVPSLTVADVEAGPAGVRAQAIGANGDLIDDFIFDGGEGALGSRVLHVRNAPSPGATSSLAIAKMIVDQAADKFKL